MTRLPAAKLSALSTIGRPLQLLLCGLLIIVTMCGNGGSAAGDPLPDGRSTLNSGLGESQQVAQSDDATAQSDEVEAAREDESVGEVRASDLPRLVAGLGSDSWAVREQAESRLKQMNRALLVHLDPHLARATDAEVLWRLERVYRELVPQPEYARPEDQQPGFLGIGFEIASSEQERRLDERQSAARITMIVADSPAEAAGLLVGDLLVAIDGAPLVGDFQFQHLQRMLVARGAGQQIRMTVFRGPQRLELEATLSPRPEAELSPNSGAGPLTLDAGVLEFRWQKYWSARRVEAKAQHLPAKSDGRASSPSKLPASDKLPEPSGSEQPIEN